AWLKEAVAIANDSHGKQFPLLTSNHRGYVANALREFLEVEQMLPTAMTSHHKAVPAAVLLVQADDSADKNIAATEQTFSEVSLP
ncbi:unnamed protein product, partial [Symbiodinium microadriaticum]